MKKNALQELKLKTIDEMKRGLADLIEEVNNMAREAHLGKVKNTNAMKVKKKDIARVMTFLSMKSAQAIAEAKAVVIEKKGDK